MNFLVGEEARLFEYLISIKNEENKFIVNWAVVSNTFDKSVGNIRQVVHKLKQKGYIKTLSSKGGRNTLSTYEINNQLEQDHCELKSRYSVPKIQVNQLKNIKSQNSLTNLYFIANERETMVKIGISDNVDKRLRQHQTSSLGEKLKLLRVINSIPSALEKEIHEEFDHLRKEGEWFTLNKELKLYIQYMRIPECFLNPKNIAGTQKGNSNLKKQGNKYYE